MHPLDGSSWCWQGAAATKCAVQPRVLARLWGTLIQELWWVELGWHVARMWLQLGQPRAASALAQSCYAAQALIRPGAGITVGNPAAQNAIVHSGAAALALRAMKEYPASFEVQLACGYMLCHTATWNVENQRELGEAGAFQVVLGAIRRLQDWPEARAMVGPLGWFMDFCPENRARFLEAGGIDLMFELAHKYYDEAIMSAFQCIFSTQSEEANKLRIVALGYFKLTVQCMKDFPQSVARGEAVWDMASQFIGKPEWHIEAHDAGVVEEVLKIMKDEPDLFDQGRSTDPLGIANKAGLTRVLYGSLTIMRTLADGNATHRSTLLGAGGIESIAVMLRRVGDLHGQAVFGAQFDVLGRACEALRALAGRDDAVPLAALRSSGALDQVAALVRNRAPQVCSDLLAAYPLGA